MVHRWHRITKLYFTTQTLWLRFYSWKYCIFRVAPTQIPRQYWKIWKYRDRLCRPKAGRNYLFSGHCRYDFRRDFPAWNASFYKYPGQLSENRPDFRPFFFRKLRWYPDRQCDGLVIRLILIYYILAKRLLPYIFCKITAFLHSKSLTLNFSKEISR